MTEESKSSSDSTTPKERKPRTKTSKKYCVRAICNDCRTRTFENIEATNEPKHGDVICKCKQIGCEGTLTVISIYSKQ